MDRWIDRVGRGEYQDGVAIRVRFGDEGGPGRAARAGSIFHYDGLTEPARQLIEHQSRNDIGCAASRDRHDDPDRLDGPNLGRRAAVGADQQSREGIQPTMLHEVILLPLIGPACCARAASGHAAAAPPMSVMNSRRFIFAVIRSPRRRAAGLKSKSRYRLRWRS